MAAPDSPRSVRITAAPGHADIYLDSAPVDGVVGYQLSHDIRTGLPSLILHTTAPDGALFEGMATVTLGVDQPPADLIIEFLEQMDPETLERAALDLEQPGAGRYAFTRSLLAVLAACARDGAR